MGIRFQKRISLGGGFSLNIGRRSASISAGGRGHHVTIGTLGAHASASIPRTGVSYRTGGRYRSGIISMLLLWLLMLIGIIAAQI